MKAKNTQQLMATLINISANAYRTQTYNVYFYSDTISTTVTCDPAAVTQWIAEVRYINSRGSARNIVGLDIEWRPCFGRGYNPTATLQLCAGNRCLIYQLIHAPSIPPALRDFLTNRNYTFVGVSIRSDMERLLNDYQINVGGETVDLGRLAAQSYGRVELGGAGLKALASLVLGKEMEKPQGIRLSRWDDFWLTAKQVEYACIDAFVSMEIGKALI